MIKKLPKYLEEWGNVRTFALAIKHKLTAKKNKHDGAIAQLVEQRTENPCVPGSIPGGTTKKESYIK